jgi:hypothetical protein
MALLTIDARGTVKNDRVRALAPALPQDEVLHSDVENMVRSASEWHKNTEDRGLA